MTSNRRTVVLSALTMILCVFWLQKKGKMAANKATTTTLIAESTVAVDPLVELYEATTPQRLQEIAGKYRKEYQAAQPFPHVVLDGIFPPSILAALEKEIPEAYFCADASKCKNMRTAQKKSYIDAEADMGYYTVAMFNLMRSAKWAQFLQTLTSIDHLVVDPDFAGSGVHITSRGGFLNVHADFNRLTDYQLDRRVNAFLYLNPDWSEDYGGHLELWSRDLQSCQQRILPVSGRYVVFSTTDFSYHGHPVPLTCPWGRSRRSLAVYYYTNGRPDAECLNNDCSGADHSTLYQTPACKVCGDQQCKAYDESLVPAWV